MKRANLINDIIEGVEKLIKNIVRPSSDAELFMSRT